MSDPADRLFDLLPAVIRSSDAAREWPLRDLLRVLGAEAGRLDTDIRQMYENLFIETCQPWAVPYIGDLVGYRPFFVPPGTDDCNDNREVIINPRRVVAERVGLARRKGTFSVLDDLIAAVTGWPAIVGDDEGGAMTVRVRIWRLPSWPLTRVRPFYLPRQTNCFALSVLGNDSQLFTRSDLAPDAKAAIGMHHVPEPITIEMLEASFDPYYGQDKSLVLYENDHPIDAGRIKVQDLSNWEPEVVGNTIALDPVHGRVMFPERYRPRRFTASYYYGFASAMGGGEYPRPLANATVGMSLFRFGHLADHGRPLLETLRTGEGTFTERLRAAFTPGVLDMDDADPVVVEQRLSEELNRIMQAHNLADWLTEDALPLADEAITLLNLRPRGPRRIRLNRLLLEASYPTEIARSFGLVRVTSGTNPQVVMSAVRSLQESASPPLTMVVELADSGLYVEPVIINLPPLHTLIVRAAEGCRPTIVLPERGADIDDMVISCGYGTQVILDGLMIARRAVRIIGNPIEVIVRHCTLVPGWELDEQCEPESGQEPSLILSDIPLYQPGDETGWDDCPPELLVPTRVQIDRSITGTVIIQRDEVEADPVRLDICRSIVDATAQTEAAVAAPNDRFALAIVSVVNSTIIGKLMAHAVELAENSIFMGEVQVARRQIGCMRFCYIPPESRTPRRHACQPDLVVQAASGVTPESEAARVVPRFMDGEPRYGRPNYCRLDDASAPGCATEILQGADDESEMGVYHDLYQPQRRANLQSAVVDFLPLGWDLEDTFES